MGHIIAIFGWSFRNVKWGHEPGTEKEGTVTCGEGPKKLQVIITRIQTKRKIQEYIQRMNEKMQQPLEPKHTRKIKKERECCGEEKACHSHEQVGMNFCWEHPWLKPTEKKTDS